MIFDDNVALPHPAVLPVEPILNVEPATPMTIAHSADVQDIFNIISNVSANHISYSQAIKASGIVQTNLWEDNNGGDSGGYDSYSSDYGYWNPDGGIDWAGSNAVSDGAYAGTENSIAQIHLAGSNERESGSFVNVYFAGTTSDGKNGDQAVTYNLAQVTADILTATPENIQFVNVTATTNGVHSANSDHYVGDAVDINQVNGQSISGSGRDLGLQLEAQALANPNLRYVEGPGGNWARSESGAAWQRSADLPTMNNHVHWSTFRD
jgi:hypothetical protein